MTSAAFVEDRSVLGRRARAAERTLRHGPHADQVADLRGGGATARARPLLVFVHGGFWRPAYDRQHAEALSTALADAGWSVLTLEYRRVPAQPDLTTADIAAALATLPDQVTDHNGQLLLVGHSAGGQLALWAAVTQASMAARCAAVVALAPVADLQLAERLKLDDGAVRAFLGQSAAARADLDPMRLPTPLAPVHIVHGLCDEVVPPDLARSYRGAHPQVTYTEFAAAGHYALIDPQSAAWPHVLRILQSPV